MKGSTAASTVTGLSGENPAMDLTLRQWLYLGALVGILLLFQRLKRVFLLFSLAILPGTFCHELCHLCIGALLGGRPTRLTLLPKREGTSWIMGSVAFANVRWYNAFFLGVAPLLLLPAAWALLAWRLEGITPGWVELLWLYLIANLAYASLPSWQDLRIAARSPIGWLLLAAALGVGWYRWSTPPGRSHQLEVPGLPRRQPAFRDPGQHVRLGQSHQVG